MDMLVLVAYITVILLAFLANGKGVVLMISLKTFPFSYDGQENNGLHNVSLEIPKGQCVLLCGESGCGKTTITRLINGLIPHFFQWRTVR